MTEAYEPGAGRPEADAIAADRIAVTEDLAGRYFQITVDGAFAGGLVYEVIGSRMTFTHTFIEPSLRGRGLVGVLIRDTLEQIRDRGLTLDSRCPILDDYVTAHPELDGLVARHSRR